MIGPDDPEDFDQTPDPEATDVLTQGQGGTTGSAINSNINNLNLSGGFDPTAIAGFIQGAESAVSPAAQTSDNTSDIRLNTAPRGVDDVQTNCLDPYIDVEYHISLAMVSQSSLAKIRGSNVQGVDLGPGDYIVFASTAEALTNSDEALDYYNIQGFSFTSAVGHRPTDPLVAVTWDGKMRVYEPYGFALREDLADMAQELGYNQSISPNGYIYRFEIWFSGWNPQDGSYNPQISIPCPRPGNPGNQIKSTVYYCVIPSIEAKVTHIGTMYDLSFFPISYYATRAEIIIAHNDSIFKGGIKAQQGTTFRNFLQDLANKMRLQILTDTQHKYDVTYEFTGIKALLDAPFIQDTSINLSSGTNFDPAQGSHASSGHVTDILTIIYNAMGNLRLVRDLALQEQDTGFTKATVHWNIRTNTKESTSTSGEINSDLKFTFQYIIEPVLTIRHRLPETKDFNSHVDQANQNSRIQTLIGLGGVSRIYNYYFTEGNSEVIDFDFHLKQFYYTPIYYKGVNTIREQDHWTGDLSKSRDQSLFVLQSDGSQQTNNAALPNLNFTPGDSGSNSFASLFGTSSSSGTGAVNRPANTQQYMHRAADVIYSNDVSGDSNTRKFLTARDQYSRYDMLRATMRVRGDPIWLLNPYMSGSDLTPVLSEDQQDGGTFTYAHVDRAIFLNARAPNQKSFMNPDLSSFSNKRTAILGGFYQVILVRSEFEAGKFTQTLDMLKYPHLNYNMFNPVVSDSGGNINLNSGVGPNGADPTAAQTVG